MTVVISDSIVFLNYYHIITLRHMHGTPTKTQTKIWTQKQHTWPTGHSPSTSTGVGEGVNKMEMDLQYFHGGGGQETSSPRLLEMDLQYFGGGGGCHHFGSKQVFQPVQISRR